MDYVARGVKRNCWASKTYLKEHEVSADALSCLKTQGGGLSFWSCGPDRESFEEAALAIAASPNKDRLDDVDIVRVPADEFKSSGLKLIESRGRTRATKLTDRHRDVAELSTFGLHLVAMILEPHVNSQGNCRRFRKKELAELVKQSIDAGDIDQTSLPEKIVAEVQKLEKPKTP